ncbi:MAG: magnesium/cobalt transporter CorA [Chloroflexi bacterium]|nr:magnesium/cobalt transporter CorA [Chloroflexota bacterium]
MIKTYVWEPGVNGIEARDFARELRGTPELETISDLLDAHDRLIWLDLERPSPEDLRLVAEEFGFHELAVEDAGKRHQRPKIEEYESFYFLVVYAVRPAGSATHAAAEPAAEEDEVTQARRRQVQLSTGSFILDEISCFVGERYLVTVHDAPIPYLDQTLDRWRRNRKAIAEGIGVLLYTILDGVVDGYFPILDDILERAEALQETIFVGIDGGQAFDMQSLFELKRDLLALRRVLVPERDVFLVLARQNISLFDRAVNRYFQDVYDHVVRITETMDVYQDLLTNALEAYLSLVSNKLTVQSNQLNQVMKTLTSLTLIFIVPTLIAGIYGMNFEHMPELRWRYGYVWALGLMAATGSALFVYFRRKHWL